MRGRMIDRSTRDIPWGGSCGGWRERWSAAPDRWRKWVSRRTRTITKAKASWRRWWEPKRMCATPRHHNGRIPAHCRRQAPYWNRAVLHTHQTKKTVNWLLLPQAVNWVSSTCLRSWTWSKWLGPLCEGSRWRTVSSRWWAQSGDSWQRSKVMSTRHVETIGSASTTRLPASAAPSSRSRRPHRRPGCWSWTHVATHSWANLSQSRRTRRPAWRRCRSDWEWPVTFGAVVGSNAGRPTPGVCLWID